jgi:hypothetical protein
LNNKTLQFVAEAIRDNYEYSLDDSIEIVTNSFLPELLEELPDYVTHYDAEYWASEIMSDIMAR